MLTIVVYARPFTDNKIEWSNTYLVNNNKTVNQN